jgi:tetratricopeptide (TPR) repeat protein
MDRSLSQSSLTRRIHHLDKDSSPSTLPFMVIQDHRAMMRNNPQASSRSIISNMSNSTRSSNGSSTESPIQNYRTASLSTAASYKSNNSSSSSNNNKNKSSFYSQQGGTNVKQKFKQFTKSPRREFWGYDQSKRHLVPIFFQTNRVDSNKSKDSNTSMAGYSTRFQMYNSDFDDAIVNAHVRRILKFMFSTLAVVFQETKIHKDGISYCRLPSIPSGAALMLWTELIGGLHIHPLTTDAGVGTHDHESRSVSSNDSISSTQPSPIQWLHGHSCDPSLSKDTLEAFVDFVNSGANPLRKSDEPSKGFWKKNIILRQPKSERNLSFRFRQIHSKDPFLTFVRDILVQLGFLVLAGRITDDEIYDKKDIAEDMNLELCDVNMNDESQKGETSKKSRTGSLKSDRSELQDSTVDFSGWDQRRQRIQQESQTQYFQIYNDLQFQYGVYLSGLSPEEGGFSTSTPTSLSQQDNNLESVATRERETMLRWNREMANACARQMAKFGILDMRNVPIQSDSWLSFPSVSPFDDATTYAIQMYPSHLLRAGRVVEAARVLMNPKVYMARIVAMDPHEATRYHTQNLEDMTKRSQLALKGNTDVGGDGNSIDSKDIQASTVKTMMKIIKERYPLMDDECDLDDPKIKGEKEDGEIGRSLHMIASFLGNMSQGKLALEIYSLSVTYKVAALGADHASVGKTWRHIGHQHMHHYEYDDAVRAYSESIRIERLQHKVEYRHVVLALNSMAMIYGMTRRPKKAVDCYGQSLDVQRAHFGEASLQVAESLNSMGIVYGMMRDYDNAIKCYKESLSIKVQKLGKDHEDVADVQFNLGLVHNKNGDHDVAINAYQEALRIRKAIHGEEHEDVAMVLHHIGVVLFEMEETQDAKRFYEECLRIRRRVLGDEHEDVARTLHNLGMVCHEAGENDRALDYLQDAVQVGRKKVGKQSDKVADSLHVMGLVSQKLAKFKEAISKYDSALKIRRAALGNDHLDVANTLHNMGDVYYMMGDLDQAMDAYEDAYEIRIRKFGDKHLEVASTRNNMGVVFMKKGDYDAAMECFASALIVREALLGPDHEKCSDTLHNMGLVHKSLKQHVEAIQRYEQALRVRRIQLGDNDMKVADTLYNMAIVYANTSQYAKALDHYKEALRTYRETGMSDDHPSVVNTLQWIKWGQKKVQKANSSSRK